MVINSHVECYVNLQQQQVCVPTSIIICRQNNAFYNGGILDADICPQHMLPFVFFLPISISLLAFVCQFRNVFCLLSLKWRLIYYQTKLVGIIESMSHSMTMTLYTRSTFFSYLFCRFIYLHICDIWI